MLYSDLPIVVNTWWYDFGFVARFICNHRALIQGYQDVTKLYRASFLNEFEKGYTPASITDLPGDNWFLPNNLNTDQIIIFDAENLLFGYVIAKCPPYRWTHKRFIGFRSALNNLVAIESMTNNP